jgi:hypothetical protein
MSPDEIKRLCRQYSTEIKAAENKMGEPYDPPTRLLDRCKHCGNQAEWHSDSRIREMMSFWRIQCSVCGIRTRDAYSEEGCSGLVVIWNRKPLE